MMSLYSTLAHIYTILYAAGKMGAEFNLAAGRF